MAVGIYIGITASGTPSVQLDHSAPYETKAECEALVAEQKKGLDAEDRVFAYGISECTEVKVSEKQQDHKTYPADPKRGGGDKHGDKTDL